MIKNIQGSVLSSQNSEFKTIFKFQRINLFILKCTQLSFLHESNCFQAVTDFSQFYLFSPSSNKAFLCSQNINNDPYHNLRQKLLGLTVTKYQLLVDFYCPKKYKMLIEMHPFSGVSNSLIKNLLYISILIGESVLNFYLYFVFQVKIKSFV